MVGTSKSGNRFSKDHGLLLFLGPELILALADVQVKKKIGRTYAGLYALTVGLHQLGAIDDETFAILEKRYSEKLVPEQPQKPLTPVELLEKQKLQAKDGYFLSVLDQWDIHDSKWRLKALANAEKFQDKLESARRVLALRQQEAPAKT
jgi:hypothetical protein